MAQDTCQEHRRGFWLADRDGHVVGAYAHGDVSGSSINDITMARLTRRPWFGPKTVAGWGLTPITWQGWLATVLLIILVAAALSLLRRTALAFVVVVLLVAAYVALAALTGTAPGGPRRS